MLKIRLQRVGRKNDPSFRAVCVDSRRGPKVGKHTEVLGSYDPKRDYIAINGERVKHWISKGAQVSDTMHNLLVKDGVIKAKKIHVAKDKKKIKLKEEVAIKEEVKVEVEAPSDTPAEAPSKEEEKTEASVEEKTEEKKETPPAEAEPKEEIKEEPKPASPDASQGGEDVKEEVAPEKKEVV